MKYETIATYKVKVNKANKDATTLKSSTPKDIIKFLKLKVGDELQYSIIKDEDNNYFVRLDKGIDIDDLK